jgi:hypothetical protein
MIRTEGRVQGHFTDHAHAVAAAIDIAESIGKTGRDAQVLVHAESRTFRKRHQVLSSTDDAALWCAGGIGIKRRRCSRCQPALDAASS